MGFLFCFALLNSRKESERKVRKKELNQTNSQVEIFSEAQKNQNKIIHCKSLQLNQPSFTASFN